MNLKKIEARVGCGWEAYSFALHRGVTCGSGGYLCSSCSDRALLLAEVKWLKGLNSRTSDLLESLRRAHYESFNKDDDTLLAELKEAASES